MAKKYICTVCGYIHEGDSAPEKCPLCTPHDLRKAFSFHNAYTETGDMRQADLD